MWRIARQLKWLKPPEFPEQLGWCIGYKQQHWLGCYFAVTNMVSAVPGSESIVFCAAEYLGFICLLPIPDALAIFIVVDFSACKCAEFYKR